MNMPRKKPAEPIKRVMIELPEPLHLRIKLSATSRRMTMLEAIREVLERAPWPVEGIKRERVA
jgi:hypothetical protein